MTSYTQNGSPATASVHSQILQQLGADFCDRHIIDMVLIESAGLLLMQLQSKTAERSINRLLALIGCELSALSMVDVNAMPAADVVNSRLRQLSDALNYAAQAMRKQLDQLDYLKDGFQQFPVAQCVNGTGTSDGRSDERSESYEEY